jgi:hypothetical protein
MSLLQNQIVTYHNLFFNTSTTGLLSETGTNVWKPFRTDKILIVNKPFFLQQKKQPERSSFRYKNTLQDFFSSLHVDIPVFLQKKLQNDKNLIGGKAR